jgi:glycosyltransferase involved in cell wall biosynthesis
VSDDALREFFDFSRPGTEQAFFLGAFCARNIGCLPSGAVTGALMFDVGGLGGACFFSVPQGDFLSVVKRFGDKCFETATVEKLKRFFSHNLLRLSPKRSRQCQSNGSLAHPRLLYISGRSDIGGGPVHMDVLMQGLADPENIFLACPREEPFFSRWQTLYSEQHIFVLPRRSFNVSKFFQLHRWTKAAKPEIIHAHGKAAGLYGRLLKCLHPRLKCIYTYHGFHYREYSGIARFCYIAVERLLEFFTDAIIHVSPSEKQEANKHGLSKNERKTRVVLNGIPDISLSPTHHENIRDEFSIPRGARCVLSVCRFSPQKNMALCLDIARAMQTLATDVVFLWVGDGEERVALEKKIKSRDIRNIHLVGFRSDVGAIMRMSDLFLSTSLWEGLPLTLIEYLSLGKPVYATNVVGNRDVITHCKEGILFDPKDAPQRVARDILSLLNDPERLNKFGINARKRYLALFTSSKMIKRTISIYYDLLK